MKPVRPHMPVAVQRDAALIALGLELGKVEYHHEPPLAFRPYDPATGRWTPDANDPRYIVPMATEAHRARTPADTTAAAKVKRVTKAHETHLAVITAKQTGDDPPRDVKRVRIQSRGFDKRHQPMRWKRPASVSPPQDR